MRMSSGGGSAKRVAVLGASGFAGGELVRLLSSHPNLRVTFVGGNASAGSTLAQVHPHLAALPAGGLSFQPTDAAAVADAADLVFSALPNGVCAAHVPAFVEADLTVIDLSGDYRLPAEAYPRWYGYEHPAPDWLDKAVYGLPELFAERLPGARLVANPGCYPTPVILGCAPLVRAGLIEAAPIHVDGKTGSSGAGRAATEATTFAATEESVRPYRVPGHQHIPEMEQGIELASGAAVPVLFVPHLVPTVRGVLTTSYARLAEGVTTEELVACLAASYTERPFVRTLAPGEMADSKRTRGSNVVELQAAADPRTGTAIVIGAVDNLIKGAAGQAIQNANLVLGYDERAGLPSTAVYP
jgi:N-acetyl-gamma-glutamyl-phosphate reductase